MKISEYIERSAAMKFMDEVEPLICYDANGAVFSSVKDGDMLDFLLSIPAADVRPVVLCRDCKYCRKVDEFEYWCEGFYSPARLVRKDDFCSQGGKDDGV